MTSVPDLEDQISKFQVQHQAVRESEPQLRTAFDDAITAVRWAGHLAAGPNPFAHGAVEELVRYIEDRRAEVEPEFVKLLGKLEEVAEGLLAPLTFLHHAEAWEQQVGGGTRTAYNTWSSTNLDGYWQGLGATRYSVTRDAQGAAVEVVTTMTDTLAEHLRSLAVAARDFYATMIEALVAYVAAAAAVIAKFATVVEAPFAASDAVDLVTGIANLATTMVLTTVTLLLEQEAISGQLTTLVTAQAGLPGNAWPTAATSEFNDSTVTDGSNAWSVPSDGSATGG